MSNESLPQVNDGYVRRVFDALSNMDVDLDSDPLIYGPKRMIAKVARCREHLSRCQQIFLQISDDLHRLKRTHRKAKLDFELQMQDLLANDPDVRSGKNVRDREAVATMKLRVDREEMANIESAIQDLDAVMTVVKAKREDLKDIQGRLRDQVKLCQEEIGLGGKWGSAPPPGARVPNLEAAPKVNREALDTLNELMGGVEGEASVSDLEQFVLQELSEHGDLVEEESLEESEEPSVIAKPAKESAPSLPEVVAKPEPSALLPEVVVKPEPVSTSTATAEEIDSFLDTFAGPPAKTSAANSAAPPISTDIDLDELLGAFE